MSAVRLRHDLGKYIARTARNVDATTPLDAELLAMLCDDLYATYDGTRASLLFARLADELADEPAASPASLTRVRELLQELDAIESAVRRGEQRAVQRAIAIACQVAQELYA